jgi:hypothetical protein
VLAETYPAGLSGGGATAWSQEFQRADRFYLSWVVKWDADFHHNGTSEKLIYFNHDDGKSLIFQFHWGAEAMYGIEPAASDYVVDGSLHANKLSRRGDGVFDAPWPRDGAYHEYEILFDRASGTVKWWKDGQLRAHHTGRSFPQIHNVRPDTTWGGGGNKQGSQRRYTDHMLVAIG